MRSSLRTALIALSTSAFVLGCSSSPGESSAKLDMALSPASAPPIALSLAHVMGMQPGWVRATFNISGDSDLLIPTATATCSQGNPSSISTTTIALSGSQIAVDVKANLTWLAANGLPLPCQVSAITLSYAASSAPSTPVASASAPYAFAMDLPLAYCTPSQLPAVIGKSVSLTAAPRRYFAYPPHIVAIHSAAGRTAFAEVEELPSRGTLGLRAMTAFLSAATTDRELGGGAELQPGWGLDVDSLGVTKTTSGVEESHPGFDTFASYTGAQIPSITAPGGPNLVFPAPPLFTEAQYEANVLDNHGVKRCPTGDCLDVVYDATNHLLTAQNGANIISLEDGPIEATYPPPAQPTTTTFVGAATLGTSKAPSTGAAGASPAPPFTNIPYTAASCALSGTSITAPVTQCGGASASVPCPTPQDPIAPDAVPFAPGAVTSNGRVLSLSTLVPYFAGRDNHYGDCVGHSLTRYEEYLYNRLAHDLLPSPAIVVDGQTISVPNPSFALSMAGGYAMFLEQSGTDTALDHSASPIGSANVPAIALAYWPALEADFPGWLAQNATNPALAGCASYSVPWYYDAFCSGQGQPPPGTYWQYSQMVANNSANPLAGGSYGLADHYFNWKERALPLGDRLAATLSALGQGLPVLLTFNEGFKSVADPTGYSTALLSSNTSWFLPPQLAACNQSQLQAAFGGGTGHAVDIVGYEIVNGANGQPDPIRSYFILENNWGKGQGMGGFYTMNFAFFQSGYITGLSTYGLDCELNSVACMRQKPVQGDVDGDHRADIALTGFPGWNTVPVAFSNGEGTFRTTNSGAGQFPTYAGQGAQAVMGDFDGDGKADVALVGGTNPQTGTPWTTIPVAFSNGDGTFRTTNSAAGLFPTYASQTGARVVAADVDGNGRADLVLAGGTTWGTIPVALSNGDGTFAISNNAGGAFATFAKQTGANLLAADFNGDGKTDLALTGGSGWTVIPVAFSNGNATFNVTTVTAPPNFTTWATQGQVVAGDFDGDGKGDLAVAGGPGWNSVPIALSTGTGAFNVVNASGGASSFAALATEGGQLVAGDYDGNGTSDLALVGGVDGYGQAWTTVPVAFSVGDGTFSTPDRATTFAAESCTGATGTPCSRPMAVSVSRVASVGHN